jgi:orotidine-5'-phosphate decarboxylase
MTSYDKLINSISSKKSMLCVGLDSDINKIPNCFEKNISGLFEFNKIIIEQTQNICSAYKINFAFYEQYGSEGFELIKQTLRQIPDNIFTIADAKRGDIGNTSAAYSKAVFKNLNFDSITANPYMGLDSISPFLEDKSKLIFLLALTSNAGSQDFQRLISDGKPIYQHIIEKSAKNFSHKNLGFVIGATHPDELAALRKIIPENPILIPGVGTQGGDIQAIKKANNNSTALINVSRAIIYPEISDEKVADINKNNEISKKDFADLIKKAAINFNKNINF